MISFEKKIENLAVAVVLSKNESIDFGERHLTEYCENLWRWSWVYIYLVSIVTAAWPHVKCSLLYIVVSKSHIHTHTAREREY